MENKRNSVFTIIITALVTCFLTTAVNGFIDNLTKSEAMEKISVVKKMLSEIFTKKFTLYCLQY